MATTSPVLDLLRCAANFNGPISAELQRRLLRWAEVTGDTAVAARLAGRTDLVADLADRLSADRTSAIRRAWLAREVADLEQFLSELHAERRHGVLRDAAKDLVERFNHTSDDTVRGNARARLEMIVAEAVSLPALVAIITSAPPTLDELRHDALRALHRAPGSLDHTLRKELVDLLGRRGSQLRGTFLRSEIHPALRSAIPRLADWEAIDPEHAQRFWGIYARHVLEHAEGDSSVAGAMLRDAHKLLANVPEPVEALEKLLVQLPERWAGNEVLSSVVAEQRSWAAAFEAVSGSDPDVIEAALRAREDQPGGNARLVVVAARNPATPERVLVEFLASHVTKDWVARPLLERPALSPKAAAALALALHRPELLRRCDDADAALAELAELVEEGDSATAFIIDLFEEGFLEGAPAELRAQLLSCCTFVGYYGAACPAVAELVLETLDTDARARFAVEFCGDRSDRIGDVLAAAALT